MAENPKKKLDEISVDDAKAFFDNAAKAFANTRVKTRERKEAYGTGKPSDKVSEKLEDGAVTLISSLTNIISGTKKTSDPEPTGAAADQTPAEPAKPERVIRASDAEAGQVDRVVRGSKDGSVPRNAGVSFQRVSIPVEEETAEAVAPKKEPIPEKEPFKVTITEEAMAAEQEEIEAAKKPKQSRRKAWYLRRQREEEFEEWLDSKENTEPTVEPIDGVEAPAEETVTKSVSEEIPEAAAAVAATTVISTAAEELADTAEDADYGATSVFNPPDFFYDDDISFEDDEDYEEEELTDDEINEMIAFNALAASLDRHKDVYGDPRKHRRNRYHDYGFGMGITFDGVDNYADYEDDYEDED